MNYRIRHAAAMIRLIDSGATNGTYDEVLQGLEWWEILQVAIEVGLIKKGVPGRGIGRELGSKQDIRGSAGMSEVFAG